MKKVTATQKIKAEEIFAIVSNQLFTLKTKKETKQKWINTHDLWMAEIDKNLRVITPVILSNQLVWADVVTGTVYYGDGRCASSGVLAININTLYKNIDHATAHLMNLKGSEVT